VYVDPSVKTALRVVMEKQRATIEERMAFLMSPASFITEAYAEEGVKSEEVPVGDTIFFETSEYSDRIMGIGEWVQPQLTYLEPGENSWLPERFSVVLAGKLVTGDREDVDGWIERVQGAMASHKDHVQLGDVVIPTNAPGLLETLQRLRPAEGPPKRDSLD